MASQKKKLSRADAQALYADLKKAMESKYGKAPSGNPSPKGASAAANSKVAAEIAKSIKQALGSQPEEAPIRAPSMSNPASGRSRALDRGQKTALVMALLCAAFKVTIAGLESTGILTVPKAQASMAIQTTAPFAVSATRGGVPAYSKEEVRILTSLDSRRVQLEERSRKLDLRQSELDKRDSEMAVKIAELKELTERLKIDRDKADKKKVAQLDQLANVYGSMNPQEAAALMEQLDVTIALDLISRMPEKRIGQILALMSPDKALAITRMLSAR
ncbi:MAG: hypothetical protein K1X83_14265 [Oligoflexia bacterium]|nr:hypothetical protein [Oligoflexia bacterium]